MIKHCLTFFLLAVAALFTLGCSDTSQPEEGKHYVLLPNDLSSINPAPLSEVFSLTCSHCRNLEQLLPALAKASGQQIEQIHVTFNQSAKAAAFVYYTAVMQLGHAPDVPMMRELFSAIQSRDFTPQQRQEAINSVFSRRDLSSPDELDEQSRSKLAEMVANASQITVQGEINSVPMFIVAGKYQIIMAEHKNVADVANTITFLLNQQ